ncbi:MAG TPA: MFS transporter [Nitrospiria bacterium]|nr:MFS transporter [Nitrospiria bacterium]
MRNISFKRPFIFLCIIGLLTYFSYNLIRTPVLPLFAKDLEAAPELIGLIVAVSTITGIFVKLPSGIAADIVGRRVVLLAGVLIFSLMPFVYLFIHQIWQLILVRSIHGLATALFAPVAMAIVADLYPSNRGEYLGWYSSSTQVGKLLGPMAGGYLLGLAGFSYAFSVCGLIGLLPLFLAVGVPVGSERLKPRDQVRFPHMTLRFREELKGVASDSRILVTSAMEAVQMLAGGALMAFLPIYGIEIGLSAAQVGLLFGIQGVANLVAKPMMGRLSDRMGRRPLIILGLLACALTFAMIPAVTGFQSILLLAAGFGLGEAIVTSSTAALVGDLCRNQSLGSAMGAFGTIMDIGHASGPILAGLLIAAFGYLVAFSLISLILLAGIVVFITTVRNK